MSLGRLRRNTQCKAECPNQIKLQQIMNETINSLYAEFTESYPYVSIDKRVVEQFVRKFNRCNVHFLYDFVMSQGLEDEVEI